MKRPILVYGTGLISEIAKFYFENDSPYFVKAFTNRAEFIEKDSFCKLPVLDIDDAELTRKTGTKEIFLAIGHQGQNEIRKSRFDYLLARGFHFVSYISSRAAVFTNTIGRNVFVLENNVIQPFSTIGDNCILWSGNHIGHHSRVEDHVFVSSHVVVSGNCTIETNCFLGVNATIFDGITIGRNSIVGAGCIVRKDTLANSVVRGPLSEIQTR